MMAMVGSRIKNEDVGCLCNIYFPHLIPPGDHKEFQEGAWGSNRGNWAKVAFGYAEKWGGVLSPEVVEPGRDSDGNG